MVLPNHILLTDLLSHSVRCDRGLDHGPGLTAWMHPPVHRLLGWSTRPSVLSLSRDVWSLNQLKAIDKNTIYVKGIPEISNQSTLDRLPTLIQAELLNINNIKLGIIADLVFEPKTGNIEYYLVSRTDPRIPGTSRWRLTIERITDQQPGIVLSNIETLEDLPLIKSSIRLDFVKKSKIIRDQLQDFSDKASSKLEGWLEDVPLENNNSEYNDIGSSYENNLIDDSFDDWIDDQNEDFSKNTRFYRNSSYSENLIEEEDPWV